MATWLLHFLNIFYLHSKACSFVYIWTKNCKSFIFFIDAAATPYYNEWQRRRKKQHLLSSWDRLTSPMTLNSLSGRKWIGGIPSRISDEIFKSLHSKLTLISFSSFFIFLPPSLPYQPLPPTFVPGKHGFTWGYDNTRQSHKWLQSEEGNQHWSSFWPEGRQWFVSTATGASGGLIGGCHWSLAFLMREQGQQSVC